MRMIGLLVLSMNQYRCIGASAESFTCSNLAAGDIVKGFGARAEMNEVDDLNVIFDGVDGCDVFGAGRPTLLRPFGNVCAFLDSDGTGESILSSSCRR